MFYPFYAKRVVLSRVSFSMLSKRTLSFNRRLPIWLHVLRKPVLSKKMIEDGLSRVEESAIKFTYKLGVGFERCEDKAKRVLLSSFLAPPTTKRKQ
jgi:hypothetical protein